MRHGIRNKNRGFTGNCRCPQCNYKEPHRQGVPCREMLCPICKIALEKEEYLEKNLTQQNHKNIEYPKVNPELCINCGACIEICPANAIIIENNKAKINEDNCRGCYACQNVCPSGAIS
jgi:MinD superfamily P-loop ATPase